MGGEISLFAEEKIENKDGLSQSMKVTLAKINPLPLVVVGGVVVIAASVLDAVPGDEELVIPAILDLLGTKLATT